MRQFNLPLNASKLETKKLQLASIEAQFKLLAEKLQDVKDRLDSKQAEVSELHDSIVSYNQSIAVSK